MNATADIETARRTGDANHYWNCGCTVGQVFDCDLCGRTVGWCRGGFDAVERCLASPDGGICDACFEKLPKHVKDWAEERDSREGGV